MYKRLSLIIATTHTGDQESDIHIPGAYNLQKASNQLATPLGHS